MHSDHRSMEERLRSNLLALFAAFGEHMGLAATAISEALLNDRQLHLRIKKAEGSFRTRTYDMIVGRFSTLWPDDVPWPEGIERVEEGDLPERLAPSTATKLPAIRKADGESVERRREALLAKLIASPAAQPAH